MIYILNKNGQVKDETRKMHTLECGKLPKEENRIYLKDCICPVDAMLKAKTYYSKVSHCKLCNKKIPKISE